MGSTAVPEIPPPSEPSGPVLLTPARGATAAPRAGRAARQADPVQEYFSIGEVCSLTGLRPHVLRYWETQFRALSPAKNRSGNRVYARREVELVLLVKHLLYTDKYTVDGARQKLAEHRRSRELRGVAREALAREMAHALERELRDVVDLLEGRRPPRPRAADGVARPSAEAPTPGQG